MIQEDGVGYCQRDRDAGDLAGGDEADCEGDELWTYFPLGNRERSLDEGAGAEGEEDAVTVDGGCAGMFVDGVHEGSADDVHDAGPDVPREVVACSAHDGAVGDTHDDEEDDEGEEPDAGFERGVGVHELEEERDEVDRDEGGGTGGGGFGEEYEHDFLAEEFDGEDAAFGGGEKG